MHMDGQKKISLKGIRDMYRQDKQQTAIMGVAFLIPIIFSILRNPFRDLTTAAFFIVILILYLYGLGTLFKNLTGIYEEIAYINSNIQESDSFEKIGGLLSRTENLSKIFIEYKKTLRPIESDSQDDFGEIKKEYYSTVEVEYFFNEDNVIYNAINHRTINYIPQSMPGIGILGTFLGIVDGVSGLGGKLTQDSEAIKSGIEVLLDGVQVSFNTSLYGIIFSLAFIFIMKILIDLIMGKINKLNQEIDGRLKKSTEKEGLKELEKQLSIQNSSIQKLATDLSEEMGRKFDQSLQENMSIVSTKLNELLDEIKNSFENSVVEKIAPSLEQLGEVAQNLANMQQNSTDSFIKDAINKLEEVISMGTQNEIKKLQESMGILSSTTSDMMDKFTVAVDNMQGLVGSQESLVQNTNTSAESINLTTANLQSLQEGLAALLFNIQGVNENHNVSMDNIKSTLEELKYCTNEQNKIGTALSEMIDKSYAFNKLQEDYIHKFNQTSEYMNSGLDNAKESINQIAQDIKEYVVDFAEMQQASKEIAVTLGSNYSNLTENIENASNKLNITIDNIDGKILKNVDSMNKEMLQVASKMKEFYENVSAFSNKIEQFTQVEEATQQMWKSYKDTFEDLTKNMDEGITNYTSLLRNGTDELFKNYDHKIADAINGLKGMVENISNEVENIGDIFDEIADKLKQR